MFRDLKITLTPEDGKSGTFSLSPKGTDDLPSPIFEDVPAVLSQENYTVSFKGKNIEKILNMRIYVDDEFKPGSYKDGEYRFYRSADDLPIFHDCIGSCRIKVRLLLRKKKTVYLETGRIPIIASGGEGRQAGIDLRDMLFYIAEQNARHSVSATDQAGIVQRLELAQEILEVYSRNFDLFRSLAPKGEQAIAVGFLSQLLSDFTTLEETMSQYIKFTPTKAQAYGGRLWTPAFFVEALKKLYEFSLTRLSKLTEKGKLLLSAYKMLTYEEQALYPTDLFIHMPGFRQLYDLSSTWDSFSPYSPLEEHFMNRQRSLSEIYENFCLCAFNEYLEREQFDFVHHENFIYGAFENPSRTLKYTRYNVLVYERGDVRVTIYVEPVIHKRPWPKIGFDLIRNNSVPFSGNTARENQVYYCPDYVIKVSGGGLVKDRYIILDAKFSTLETIQAHYLPALTFKYLFSISPASNDSELMGLGVIFGKCLERAGVQSMYNLADGRELRPLAVYLPLFIKNRYYTLRSLFQNLLPETETDQTID